MLDARISGLSASCRELSVGNQSWKSLNGSLTARGEGNTVLGKRKLGHPASLCEFPLMYG